MASLKFTLPHTRYRRACAKRNGATGCETNGTDANDNNRATHAIVHMKPNCACNRQHLRIISSRNALPHSRFKWHATKLAMTISTGQLSQTTTTQHSGQVKVIMKTCRQFKRHITKCSALKITQPPAIGRSIDETGRPVQPSVTISETENGPTTSVAAIQQQDVKLDASRIQTTRTNVTMTMTTRPPQRVSR